MDWCMVWRFQDFMTGRSRSRKCAKEQHYMLRVVYDMGSDGAYGVLRFMGSGTGDLFAFGVGH
jgi:hypothetical protein